MGATWIISDTHFGHANILRFTGADGNLIRPEFETVEEMDDIMCQNWSRKVKNSDTIYHLGDVAIPRKFLQLIGKLPGRKILIKGNHDIFKLQDYTEIFVDIRIICSHIPISDRQLNNRFKFNVHGHMHTNSMEDSKYLNVCVEKTNYSPISLDEVLERIKNYE
jgi:calcineurin-like phosphoesterase family protein